MAVPITLLSPAKLNLFLHITGQRPDGYHSLQTLFQLLDYGDELTFEANNSGVCQLTTPLAGVDNNNNLIIKAAQALKEATHCTLGANISIDKRLPMGGGVGGGSSNAATTLLALNHLWQTKLTLDELANIGLHLGADVPVFVYGQTAWAEGIGDVLTPVSLVEQWFIVIKPDCHVCTASIFSNEQLTRDTDAITVAAFLDQGGHNDCETVVSKLYPAVAKTLVWLRQHVDSAALTGTGACVFARFETKAEAEKVASHIPYNWDYFIAKGIDRIAGFEQLSQR